MQTERNKTETWRRFLRFAGLKLDNCFTFVSVLYLTVCSDPA